MAQNIIKIVFSVFTAKPQPSTLVYAVSPISHRHNQLEVFKVIFLKFDHVIIPRICTYISDLVYRVKAKTSGIKVILVRSRDFQDRLNFKP